MTVRELRAPTGMAMVALLLLCSPVPARAQGRRASAGPDASTAAAPIVVGSKPFAESYLLAEIFAQQLEARGVTVTRRPGLGGTEIAFPALRAGAIDVYPEYTGTGLQVILKAPSGTARDEVFAAVARDSAARFDVRWLPPLGFENTYAMSMRTDVATGLGVRTLSDAARLGPRLRAGFTADFIGLPDGLPGLRSTYGLAPGDVRALAPAVKYQALMSGDVDLIDAYSTDGLLDRYPLTVLVDDRGFFPPYDAAAVLRGAVARTRPEVVSALSELSGRLTVTRMRRWNARVEVSGDAVAAVAAAALRELGLGPGSAGVDGSRQEVDTQATTTARDNLLAYLASRRMELLAMTGRHILLTATSLGAAVLFGVPLGLWLVRLRGAETVIRGVGLLQTIPGLALLAFMLPVLGVGVTPAVVALVAYSLYPIVRNTQTGVAGADPGAVAAATALGMTPWQVLRHVQLPLAAPVVLAGIRTAAVLNVGTATLGALIGAGGLGDPIVAGLALSDPRMVLSGALPAAGLALVTDLALGWLQVRATPVPLRAAPHA